MATYVVLAQFTEQGIRAVKETVSRADAAKDAASRFGATMKDIYWTQGQYDLATIIEGDEQAVAAFGLALASQGNVKFQTMRAFSRDEMAQVVKRL